MITHDASWSLRAATFFCVFRISQNRKKSISAKKHKNIANLASGPPKSDSTRREDSDSVNESSVAALGASLVTKQAGRVPQHD